MIYLFRRKDGSYPMEFETDEDAIASAKANPGTEQVERFDGQWPDLFKQIFPWVREGE